MNINSNNNVKNIRAMLKSQNPKENTNNISDPSIAIYKRHHPHNITNKPYNNRDKDKDNSINDNERELSFNITPDEEDIKKEINKLNENEIENNYIYTFQSIDNILI